jgi:hypothetical protein
LSQNDPTDQALAAIASLLDHPAPPFELEAVVVAEKENIRQPDIQEILRESLREPEQPSAAVSLAQVLLEPPSLAHDPLDGEADGYSKFGPGPLAAIRFKWSVRRENDDAYYVDETIGENSAPVVTGPMTANAAIELVNDRESEARKRFEQIKSEMTMRSMAANLIETNSDKI